jgi:hypothetical protein
MEGESERTTGAELSIGVAAWFIGKLLIVPQLPGVWQPGFVGYSRLLATLAEAKIP